MDNHRKHLSKKYVGLILCAVVLLTAVCTYALFTIGNGQHGAVIMSIHNVTPNGLSFTIENAAKKEYTYGEVYALYILKGDPWESGSWEPVEPIIDNGGFYAIGYSIAPGAKTDLISVDWTWLYGELAVGDYKFQKDDLSCEFFIP
jgi:hypothetical protein